MGLVERIGDHAQAIGWPLSVHLDITYRCNERCEHCYLDHDGAGEMTTLEIQNLLEQAAQAGVFFLAVSGGEPLLRRDFWEIIACARSLRFAVKVKTNGVMIKIEEARRFRQLGIDNVQISLYSHREEIHDAITKLPGSWRRSVAAAKLLVVEGVRVNIANVLMRQNFADAVSVRKLAEDIGAIYKLDPTITPMMDGSSSVLSLRIPPSQLKEALHNPDLVPRSGDQCRPPDPPSADSMNGSPCSAGHTMCYVSPFGEVYPCVQFPLPCGNVRREKFIDIWRQSRELNEVRGIRLSDLPTCSTCSHVVSCSRCPGLAYLEGDVRGPSTADCEKSYARTGIVSANMLKRKPEGLNRSSALVQIGLSP